MAGRCLSVLCLSLFLTVPAAPAERIIAVRNVGRVPADGSAVRARPVPVKKLDEFRRNSDFSYDRQNAPYLSFWDWIKAWLLEKLRVLFKGVDDAVVWKALKYVVYGVIMAALLPVVVKLFGADFRGIFFSSKKRPRAIADTIGDISGVDFDELIAGHLKLREYRIAVRLMYHKALQELSARSLIKWKIDKTNTDYLSELAGSTLRGNFAELTRIFEHIWYGNFDLAEDSYAAVRDSFYGFYALVADDKS